MKLWKGRFSKEATSSADDFNSSILVDMRMAKEDILGSIAHARMLGKQDIISSEDSEKIIEGLKDILNDLEKGKLVFDKDFEDIHTAVETILTERIGETGKKLHTARSRNDQVATDFRLYMKKEITEFESLLDDLIYLLGELAKEHKDTLMPGYTHMQRAQVVTLDQHLLAYKEMFTRDKERLAHVKDLTDCLPLGACALAGTSFPIDREQTKKELGFGRLCENTLDAVSDRDFALDFLFISSMVMMHLSRFCEEIIYFSTAEFGFIEIDEAYSTGSSIMPQKKNPDMAELIRGKTGRVYGNLIALFTIMKGLPLAYNKDMQEDKEAVFDSLDTVKASVSIFTEMLASLTFNKEAMAAALKGGYMNATDAADYLVKKGVPFRECHEIIGNMVLDCIDQGKDLEDLSLEELKKYSPYFEEDFHKEISVENAVKKRRKD